MMHSKNNSLHYLCLAMLVACVALLYARTLTYDYVWDDLHYLVNTRVYRGWAGLVKAVAEPFFLLPIYYRPLALMSFVVSHKAGVQHAINVVLHAVNVVLVFQCARALMPDGVAKSRVGIWSALLGALLFAVHPTDLEAVVWVSGRFDMLVCTFVLACCWSALSGELTFRRLVLVFIFFVAALGSKESAVGLPVALPFLLLLKWRLADEAVNVRTAVARFVPIFAALTLALALYAAARAAVMPALLPPSDTGEAVFRSSHLADRLNVSTLAVAMLVRLIVVPWGYSAPMHPMVYEFGAPLMPLAVLVLAGVVALLVLAILKKPRFNFPLALLAALAMSWPVLHLIDMYNRDNIISDRYVMAPLAVLLLALAAVAAAWLTRQHMNGDARKQKLPVYAGAVCALWIMALAAHSSVTIPMWRDNNVLWAFTHQQVPDSRMAYGNYIRMLMLKGRWQEADAELKRLWIQFPQAQKKMEIPDISSLMLIRAHMGDYEGALEAFALSQQIDQSDIDGFDALALSQLYRFRGIIEGDVGHWEQAAHFLEKSLQVFPDDVESLSRFAYILFVLERGTQSNEVFEHALALMPPDDAAKTREWRKTWRHPPKAGAASAASAPASAAP